LLQKESESESDYNNNTSTTSFQTPFFKRAIETLTKHGANETGPGVDMRLQQSHRKAVSELPTTPSAVALLRMTNARFVAFLGTFAHPAQQVWLLEELKSIW